VSEGRLASIAAAVLLGGASSRMGQDKAQLTLAGRSYAGRISGLLAEYFEEVYLVGGNPPVDAIGTFVADAEGPQCPLRGLVAVLETARAPRVLILATDMPLVSPELVLALTALPEADIVLPRSPRGLQPLCAIYRRKTILPLAKRRLASGLLALHGLLEGVEVCEFAPDQLAQVDPSGRALQNINTPEDSRRL